MFKTSYILRRFSPMDADGSCAYVDKAVRLNVQSLNAKELFALPEGKRSERRVKSFGQDKVHTVDQKNSTFADRLYYNGEWYECEQASCWAHNTPIGHWECQWVVLPENCQEAAPEVKF